MVIERRWAFWRRVQYGTGAGVTVILVLLIFYRLFFYAVPTCTDGRQDGAEQGVDCGGTCSMICAFTVTPPTVQWARSFRVTDGQYNAVAYVQNTNTTAASPAVPYTFSLYDATGIITQRTGTTILPPNSVYPIFEGRINTNDRIPTQTFLQLGTITKWVNATAGADQFTVQSRTLTNADSKPRLDAQIYNNALTAANSVEVVATIFDARGNALTASQTYIDNFQPRTTQDVVFTWPEPIAKTVRSCEIPTDAAIAIDLSGSMKHDGGTPPQPISSVLTAAQAFVGRLRAGDQAALVTFATQANMINTLTNNTSAVSKAIATLVIGPPKVSGSTDTGDAIKQATGELMSTRHNTEARKILVLLTDGLANAPDPDPQGYAIQAATAAKAAGITVYAIGLGTDVDMSFLQQIASSPQQAYSALTATDVDTIYKTITASICEDGAAVIQIIPKTTASFVGIGQ